MLIIHELPLRRTRRWLCAAFIFLTFATWATYCLGNEDYPRSEPESAHTPDQLNKENSSRSENYMVTAANPYAARAGLEILRHGGNAVDAAITTQLVLNLVEPQSSGIGGGGFLLFYDRQNNELYAYDGRETAPAAADPHMFLDDHGSPIPFFQAAVGGLAVGVPGLLRMLELVHEDHGHLPWKNLFQPAIKMADKGFLVSPRLNSLITQDQHLRTFPATKRYFYGASNQPHQIGFRLHNPEFASTLRGIANNGISEFYHGQIAKEIINTVKGSFPNPGRLSLSDLAMYKAIRRIPLCAPYRTWSVCGVPPPTSGGVTTLQILGLLETFDITKASPNSADAVHLFAEASKLAFADRAHYLADPDFVDIPVTELIDKSYLRNRAENINHKRSMKTAEPGLVGSHIKDAATPPQKREGESTSHITIVDRKGNVLTMTTSIENAFGSRLMVSGFLLNNQLTDFSFVPNIDGRIVANRVEPRKRPRSSMAPTIVFDKSNRPIMALGSPGGSTIIAYVAKTVVAVLDWKLGIQEAINLPHYANLNGPLILEKGTAITALEPDLNKLGHTVILRPLNSGIHAILIDDNGLTGGADPRREGIALGD